MNFKIFFLRIKRCHLARNMQISRRRWHQIRKNRNVHHVTGITSFRRAERVSGPSKAATKTVLFYKWQLRVLRAPGGECFGRNDIPYSHIYMFLFIKHLCAIKNTKRRFFNFSEIFKPKYNNVRVEVELKYFAILHLKRCTQTNSYSLNKTVLSKTQKNMI